MKCNICIHSRFMSIHHFIVETKRRTAHRIELKFREHNRLKLYRSISTIRGKENSTLEEIGERSGHLISL